MAVTGKSSGPISPRRTDSYFNRTKTIVARYGDKRVTYALFLRRPVICAPRLMLDWLKMVAARRGTEIEVDLVYQEGDWVGAGEPIVYLTGSMVHLSDLETILLQKIGPACVAAHNAYQMALSLPHVGVPGDGGAPLRRGGNAGHDVLCGLRRQCGGPAGGGEGVYRQRQRRRRRTGSGRSVGLARCRTP